MASGLAVVTGAPGWLGNRLLHFLRHGHPDTARRAAGFVRSRPLPRATGVPLGRLRQIAPDAELVEGDIRDQSVRSLCRGATGATIFHLAGVIHPVRRTRELFEPSARTRTAREYGGRGE